MGLLINGKKFLRDLETAGSLAVYAPLEGGFAGRYQRRVRAAGYSNVTLNARGLGDLAAYLMGVHGVRPPHLGKKDYGDGAVGPIAYLPPIVTTELENLPKDCKGLLLWIIDGRVLSRQELEYLTALPKIEPRVKVVVEVGGERFVRWMHLEEALVPA
ncbi:NAD(P)H-quinone oxidoreductase subunit N [Phormidium yuhuli AB48]|uniref:NAD(P)H-quinone oxidoreductase subunit N n=1 Tax=Phormidium yuhuli AB48 TaxID=2940671 RepID=A0ABY5ASS4_9CYAN|nr:NAD(P)H-quinone oxidoreductase subunit N [Phormidium yuhuli]USR91898.1 NAD(P)H-quinone oxidoreductase subunit N [Phormidium yuhuli AB48]